MKTLLNILGSVLITLLIINLFPYGYDSVLSRFLNPFRFGAVSWPTSLDVFENPGATQSVATVVTHSTHHSNANDAIEAIEAKVGIGASTPLADTIFGASATGVSGWFTWATSTRMTATNFLATGSTTLQAFTFNTATGTSATTTNFFSTTASSTNLFTSNLGVASSTPFSALSVGVGKSITVGENRLATSTSMAIDWNGGNQQLIQKGTAGITLTFSNVVDGKKLVIVGCNPGSGTAGTFTWPTSPLIYWPGGVAPTQTTTANKCDLYSFVATKATSTSAIVILAGFNQNY